MTNISWMLDPEGKNDTSTIFWYGPVMHFFFYIPSYISGITILCKMFAYRGFPTRMVYLKHDI